MKIRKIFYSYSTVLLLLTLSGYSQKAKVPSADKKYENYSYVDAIYTYEYVA